MEPKGKGKKGKKNAEKVQEPEEVEEVEEVPFVEFTFEVLPRLKVIHLQNGLRHGDYQRYRHYCTRKLRRLRKSLKITHGKRFVRKEIDPTTITDSRYLLFYLIRTERCWAYAMQLKEDMNEPRTRVHVHHRLAKAVKYANIFLTACQTRATKQTSLEAEAYNSWMNGLFLVEKESWDQSLDKFLNARVIFEQLGTVGDLERKNIFATKVEEIDQSIRYCHYNMTGSQSADQSALLETILKSKGLETLKSKLENVLEEARQGQVSALKHVDWKGKSIEIKPDKLRPILLNCQQHVYELDKLATSLNNSSSHIDKVIELYEKLLLGYSDSIRILKDELTEMGKESVKQKLGKKIEGLVASCQSLSEYISFQKLSKTAERNLLLADLYKDKIEGKDVYIPPAFMKKSPKPDDLIRLYETLIQNTTEIAEVRGNDEPEYAKEIQAKIMSLKAFRCFYIALSYEEDNKFGEAFALLERTQQLLSTAHTHFDKLKTPNQKELLRLESLDKKVVAERCIMNAKGFRQSLIEQEKAAGEKQAEKTPRGKDKEGLSLLASLDKFDSSSVKHKHLIGIPPDVQPIQCKPLVFDLALMTYEPPNLDARKEAPKSGGFFSFWRRS